MSREVERRRKDLVNNIPVLERVLRHYSRRLTGLRDDENLQYGNDYIKNDLYSATADIQEILDLIQERAWDIESYLMQNKDIIESAFECYVHDLKEALGLVREKLNGSKLAFAGTDKEIKEAEYGKKLFLGLKD
jgi:hypothetical protein